jgi:hypothetical protein
MPGWAMAFSSHLTALAKSPASAQAAAKVSREVGTFHELRLQATVAASTAFLPSRNRASGQVARIQARLL